MGANVTAPQPAPAQIPPQVVAAADYAALAQGRLDPATWAWLSGGSGDETTLRDNQAAWSRLRLAPRVLADLRDGHTRSTLFGRALAHPIAVAPVAYQHLLHPEGERATAMAASALQAPMVVSQQAGTRLEDLSAIATAPLWLQLALQGDRAPALALLRRAEDAGYAALVLTVDAPLAAFRNREQRAGFALPASIRAVNLDPDAVAPTAVARAGDSPLFGAGWPRHMPTWDDLAWLRAQTTLPLLVKGILHPADARRAAGLGVDGLIVSNHGGRALDGAPATADALPAVAAAVDLPVLVDGGITRGTDILKALALGARAVLVGRACMHALAVAGAVGVAHVLHLLRSELEAAMLLCGCRDLAAIDRGVLWPPAE